MRTGAKLAIAGLLGLGAVLGIKVLVKAAPAPELPPPLPPPELPPPLPPPEQTPLPDVPETDILDVDYNDLKNQLQNAASKIELVFIWQGGNAWKHGTYGDKAYSYRMALVQIYQNMWNSLPRVDIWMSSPDDMASAAVEWPEAVVAMLNEGWIIIGESQLGLPPRWLWGA